MYIAVLCNNAVPPLIVISSEAMSVNESVAIIVAVVEAVMVGLAVASRLVTLKVLVAEGRVVSITVSADVGLSVGGGRIQ